MNTAVAFSGNFRSQLKSKVKNECREATSWPQLPGGFRPSVGQPLSFLVSPHSLKDPLLLVSDPGLKQDSVCSASFLRRPSVSPSHFVFWKPAPASTDLVRCQPYSSLSGLVTLLPPIIKSCLPQSFSFLISTKWENKMKNLKILRRKKRYFLWMTSCLTVLTALSPLLLMWQLFVFNCISYLWECAQILLGLYSLAVQCMKIKFQIFHILCPCPWKNLSICDSHKFWKNYVLCWYFNANLSNSMDGGSCQWN